MKKWSEVVQSPEFQGMTAAERRDAQDQYFEEVIAPQVPYEDIELAKSQFDEDYPIEPDYSTLEAAGLGAAQGASFGFADEIEAGLRSGPWSEAKYEPTLEEIRKRYAQAEAEHPVAYGVSEAGGAIASSMIPVAGQLGRGAQATTTAGRIATSAGKSAALGGVWGAGHTEAETLPEQAEDVAKSAALWGLMGGGAEMAGPMMRQAGKAVSATGRGMESVGQMYKGLPEGLKDVIGPTFGAMAGSPTAMLGSLALRKAKIPEKILTTAPKRVQQVGGLLQSAPEKLGKFEPKLREAALRGSQALISTDFVLQQQNPEYREMMKVLGEPEEEKP